MQDIYGSIFISECSAEITDAAFRVYIYLRLRQNKSDECWPSLNTIVKDTGKARSTVIKSIKELEEKGHVMVHRTRIAESMNAVNRYECKTKTKKLDEWSSANIGPDVVRNSDQGSTNTRPKNKHIKQTIENNSVDELKAYSKSKGGLMIIHKNRIEEMLKDFTVEQLKRAIDSGTKWAEKNEVGRKNLSRSIVEHSIKNSKPKVAKYMTSDEYKKKFPGKKPVKTDKEVWF
jgi:DNA-binding MarR family transcriptional regulator